MHPMLAEQFANAHAADLHAEAGQSMLIKSTRPRRHRVPRRAWWRRDLT